MLLLHLRFWRMFRVETLTLRSSCHSHVSKILSALASGLNLTWHALTLASRAFRVASRLRRAARGGWAGTLAGSFLAASCRKFSEARRARRLLSKVAEQGHAERVHEGAAVEAEADDQGQFLRLGVADDVSHVHDHHADELDDGERLGTAMVCGVQVPIRSGVVGTHLMVEEVGRQIFHRRALYVLQIFNHLDHSRQGEFACNSAEEVEKWVSAFKHAKEELNTVCLVIVEIHTHSGDMAETRFDRTVRMVECGDRCNETAQEGLVAGECSARPWQLKAAAEKIRIQKIRAAEKSRSRKGK